MGLREWLLHGWSQDRRLRRRGCPRRRHPLRTDQSPGQPQRLIHQVIPMEKVLWEGPAALVPSNLVQDEDIAEFVEVCKYLDCRILVTEDGSDICYRADLPAEILERGYIEYRNKITDFEFQEPARLESAKQSGVFIPAPVPQSPPQSLVPSTIVTMPIAGVKGKIMNAQANNAASHLTPEALAAMTAMQTQQAAPALLPAAKEDGLWDNKYVRYGVYAAATVAVGVAGYYAYKHFTRDSGAGADIPQVS